MSRPLPRVLAHGWLGPPGACRGTGLPASRLPWACGRDVQSVPKALSPPSRPFGPQPCLGLRALALAFHLGPHRHPLVLRRLGSASSPVLVQYLARLLACPAPRSSSGHWPFGERGALNRNLPKGLGHHEFYWLFSLLKAFKILWPTAFWYSIALPPSRWLKCRRRSLSSLAPDSLPRLLALEL